ncbi:MAG: protein-L-isoaspartate(D-aspartate) O-methyltransferase [Ginsengibacter sp.]
MRKFEDTYRHKGLRKQLIETIKDKGISDENVLQAMMNIPRHYFLDTALDNIAYQDRAFPIQEGQTISQPYTVAFQTQLLEVKPYDKILEIGTGSAYQAVVLAEMGANVFTIERQRGLFEKNKNLFEKDKDFMLKLKYPTLKFFYGDGFEGLPTYAPFDKILITAAAPIIPPKLLTQLRTGGKMVLPLDDDGMQKMMRITRDEDGNYSEERFSNFSFVPMLRGKN